MNKRTNESRIRRCRHPWYKNNQPGLVMCCAPRRILPWKLLSYFFHLICMGFSRTRPRPLQARMFNSSARTATNPSQYNRAIRKDFMVRLLAIYFWVFLWYHTIPFGNATMFKTIDSDTGICFWKRYQCGFHTTRKEREYTLHDLSYRRGRWSVASFKSDCNPWYPGFRRM